MPIYEFICESCNHKEDLIRKISEPTTISCPKCNGQNFIKQVSAPNFKLKGSGWYETDFKTGAKKNIVDAKDDKASKPKETKKITDTSPSSGTEK